MSKRKPYPLMSASGVDAGPMFWRSLEEKADPEAAQKRATAEFPDGVLPTKEESGLGRRGFMMFAGISAALAGLEGCARRPVEKIFPFTRMPEYSLPGVPYHYATARAHRGEAIGLIVESHEGRPTKIEGNPQHPSSLGGTDALTQAITLDLYDPDRSKAPTMPLAGKEAAWGDFDAFFEGVLKKHEADGGAGLRILAQPTTSPTFLRLRSELKTRYPSARVHSYAPVSEV
jgi:molybdopterin-containing oxidoreductase family iron-sulfur binding subunit